MEKREKTFMKQVTTCWSFLFLRPPVDISVINRLRVEETRERNSVNNVAKNSNIPSGL